MKIIFIILNAGQFGKLHLHNGRTSNLLCDYSDNRRTFLHRRAMLLESTVESIHLGGCLQEVENLLFGVAAGRPGNVRMNSVF